MPVKLLIMVVTSASLTSLGCGSVRTPSQSGGQNAVKGGSAGHQPYNTRDAALTCIRAAGVKGAEPEGRDRIRLPMGASVSFAADRGAAAGKQARGEAEGAEMVGPGLFFVGSADGNLTARVEACL